MNIRLDEDYYFWCCDWCDSENMVLRVKLQDGIRCGACQRSMSLIAGRCTATGHATAEESLFRVEI